MDLKLYYLDIYDGMSGVKEHLMISDSKEKVYIHLFEVFYQTKIPSSINSNLISELTKKQQKFDIKHQGKKITTESGIKMLCEMMVLYCKQNMKLVNSLSAEDVKKAFKAYSDIIQMGLACDRPIFLE